MLANAIFSEIQKHCSFPVFFKNTLVSFLLLYFQIHWQVGGPAQQFCPWSTVKAGMSR